MDQFLQYVRSVVPIDDPAQSPDRELLDRFVRRRDEAAFAAIVARYGAGIWSSCRRLLDREQDAEDAFQATFLTLARRAGSIRGGDSVPAWLHGVARRIAANLRRAELRRSRNLTAEANQAARRDAELSWQEGLAVLDEELDRLPQRYRAVLIVCCLEGRSRDEAAAQLGWSEGQVKGRLERARKMLRARLERRGVDLAAILLAAAVSKSSGSAAPLALAAATIQGAMLTAAGLGASRQVVSANAAILAEGAVKGMAMQKFRIAAAILITIAISGGTLLACRAALGTATAQDGRPLTAQSDEDTAAKEAAAKAEAQRHAAIQAAKQKETPAFPIQGNAAKSKVDFEEASISIADFTLLARETPQSIRIVNGGPRGDGACVYRIEERPARGPEPKRDAAVLTHTLAPKQLRRLEELLKKTDWLSAPGYEGRATHTELATYTLTVKRQGKTRTIKIEGEKGEPYKSLVSFYRGLAMQENIIYRTERLTAKERNEAFAEIDRYVRAEQGEPYAKPIFDIDLHRYIPKCQRCVRNAYMSSIEEIGPSVRLLGHLQVESEREYIAALANDRDMNLRSTVAEALGKLGGKESVPVLKRMIRSTPEAAWELIRLGDLAVPTIVEVIEAGTDPDNEQNPTFLDYEHLIRAYIDHWKQVSKPIDPRVIEAVRKSMAFPKVKAFRIVYHKQFLDLVSRSTTPK